MRARWRRVWAPFWVLPTFCCVLGSGLALVLSELDKTFADNLPFLFGGGPNGARALLSAITTSMISVTGLVFSITVVVLALASSQFSPRILRSFLNSRVTQLTLGVFAATFLYAIVVLRSVRGGRAVQDFVPQLGVTGAFVLVLASVGLFLAYIQHITQAIRVTTILQHIGAETRALINAQRADPGPESDGPGPQAPAGDVAAPRRTLTSTGHGVVARIDAGALVRHAERHALLLEVLPPVGAFVAKGMAVVVVHGVAEDLDVRAVLACVRLTPERSMEQDIAFGLRQLVDMAERALSPGVNDPTTAVQVLDEVHDLLRRLAVRPDPAPVRPGQDGEARLIVHPQPFAELLDLGVDEIAHYGEDAPRVLARVHSVLADLEGVARPEHRAVVAAKRRQLGRVQVHGRLPGAEGRTLET